MWAILEVTSACLSTVGAFCVCPPAFGSPAHFVITQPFCWQMLSILLDHQYGALYLIPSALVSVSVSFLFPLSSCTTWYPTFSIDTCHYGCWDWVQASYAASQALSVSSDQPIREVYWQRLKIWVLISHKTGEFPFQKSKVSQHRPHIHWSTTSMTKTLFDLLTHSLQAL